ncbi:MAG: Nucleolar protein 16 [Vezdaea acicularis]|nr:MAG: Nucleolar protein 16 [Vezdaea acicularis]
MGRELQKKKRRSSIPKVRQKPKSKKLNLQANPTIAANWHVLSFLMDKAQTFRQNYNRLGLASRLNSSTGGVERTRSIASKVFTSETDSLIITSSVKKSLIPGEVKVERDASGNIARIIRTDRTRTNPLNDPLNEMASDNENAALAVKVVEDKPTKGIVGELIVQSENVALKTPRKQSKREEEWVERLVDKYGDDFVKMARDRKLNPMQQSEGDLRKRVRRWREFKASALSE